MNLHDPIIDRDAGTWVMFRPGELPYGDPCPCGRTQHPPVWMVEAAKPCGCDNGMIRLVMNPETGGRFPCPDCLDGKRRIAAVVPCRNVNTAPSWDGTNLNHWCEMCDGHAFVTVGHVVVEWGPLVVVEKPSDANGSPYMVKPILSDTAEWWAFVCPTGVFVEAKLTRLPLLPDVDPQSLVGQYAIGGRLVTP